MAAGKGIGNGSGIATGAAEADEMSTTDHRGASEILMTTDDEVAGENEVLIGKSSSSLAGVRRLPLRRGSRRPT